MAAPHSVACDADDCPCWLSGRDSMRLELIERHTAVIEAMSALVEMLTTAAEGPESGRSGS